MSEAEHVSSCCRAEILERCDDAAPYCAKCRVDCKAIRPDRVPAPDHPPREKWTRKAEFIASREVKGPNDPWEPQ